MEIKERFAAASDDVNVRRPMVVRINHDAQAVEPKSCRHPHILPYFLSA